ncbi:4a-hydroxytetrahydrobiopterin dehydratase [Saccharopolyspora erythraea]|nr:4a-hydroxytetrahydrobiopterin dehydratase [Saccharopolyspora erythraea]QRK90897.1 4a-hydroxytetrahydrobiopterin dehydratase [Saccharopolyspora erythraea]
MAELLTDDQISSALEHLPEWRHEEGELTRSVELASFPQAIQVVNRIAEIAEQENHHPDIDVRWRNLTFHCVTHSKGGITQADVSMAQEIDSAIDAFQQS